MSYHRTTDKQARIFFARGCAMLELVGAKQIERRNRRAATKDEEGTRDYAQYEISTRLGRLVLSVYDDWIPSRFDTTSPDRCAINGGSGKWNHLYRFTRTTDLTDLDQWLEMLAEQIKGLIRPEPERSLEPYYPPTSDSNPGPKPQTRAKQLATAKALLEASEAEMNARYTWRKGEINEEDRIIKTSRDEEAPVTFFSIDPWDIETLETLIEEQRDIAELRRVVARLEAIK